MRIYDVEADTSAGSVRVTILKARSHRQRDQFTSEPAPPYWPSCGIVVPLFPIGQMVGALQKVIESARETYGTDDVGVLKIANSDGRVGVCARARCDLR